MVADLDAREVRKSQLVGAQDLSPRGLGSGRDDQIVCTTRRALSADMDQQFGVRLRDRLVVVDDRDRRQDIVEEGKTISLASARGQHDANPQLGHGDGRDRDLVIIVDGLRRACARAVGVDEERGVE